MEWVLIISIQWVVAGLPTAPTTFTIDQFATEQLCNSAVQTVKAEVHAPPGETVVTHSRVVCVQRKASPPSQ